LFLEQFFRGKQGKRGRIETVLESEIFRYLVGSGGTVFLRRVRRFLIPHPADPPAEQKGHPENIVPKIGFLKSQISRLRRAKLK